MKFPTSFHLNFMGKMEAANEAHGPKPRNMSWSSTTDVAFGTTYSCCAKTSEERSWDTNLLNVFKGERGNGNVRKSTWHLTKKIMSLRALFGPVTAVVASTTNLILMCLAVYLDYYDGSNTRLFKTALLLPSFLRALGRGQYSFKGHKPCWSKELSSY